MNQEERYSYIVRDVVNNVGNRDLVFRWKNPILEKMIYEATNKKAIFYVSRAKSRIDNVETFSDEVLKGKSQQLYLVLDFKWNNNDADRYQKMGFQDIKDYCFALPESRRVDVEKTEKIGGCGEITDNYGNSLKTRSKISVIFTGINSSVVVGENVVLPRTPIKIGSNITIVIEDSCRVESAASIKLAEGSSLTLHKNVTIWGMHILVNNDSVLEIGENTTMQTGKIRTGRNQIIKIGEDCMFSWDIVFLAHDGHLLWNTENGHCINNTIGETRESITLGNHVWVGGETVFLPNTKIDSGSVCGYRSLVKGQFPNNCIIAGSPAKILRKNIAWTRANTSLSEKDYYKLCEDYRIRTIK